MGGAITIPQPSELEPERRVVVLGGSPSLEAIAQQIKSGAMRKIAVLSGAGVSVSAGIPDFRTPGTGLYDNLAKYDLPTPESVFNLDFFREKPEPFCQLAKELFPGGFHPTPAHFFVRLLQVRRARTHARQGTMKCIQAIAQHSHEKRHPAPLVLPRTRVCCSFA